MSQQARGRLGHLDILRAVAILVVLVHHIGRDRGVDWPFKQVIAMVHDGGWAGVDFFFVLSGFLVSGLLFREHQKYGNVQLGRFLIRRGFKIYPPLYFIGLCLYIFRKHEHIPFTTMMPDLLFYSDYVSGSMWGTWSLGVEEKFYFALAFFVAIARRVWTKPNPFIALMPLGLFSVGLCLWMRIDVSNHFPYTYERNLYPAHLRFDALMFGVTLSYLYHFHTYAFADFARRWRRLLWIVSLALVSPCLFYPLEGDFFMHTTGHTCELLGYGGLTVIAVTADAAPYTQKLWYRILTTIGVHSYSIYLWHQDWDLTIWPRIQAAFNITPEPFWAHLGVFGIVGGILTGILASKLIEMPALALRDRWFPSRSGTLAPTAPEEVDTEAKAEDAKWVPIKEWLFWSKAISEARAKLRTLTPRQIDSLDAALGFEKRAARALAQEDWDRALELYREAAFWAVRADAPDGPTPQLDTLLGDDEPGSPAQQLHARVMRARALVRKTIDLVDGPGTALHKAQVRRYTRVAAGLAVLAVLGYMYWHRNIAAGKTFTASSAYPGFPRIGTVPSKVQQQIPFFHTEEEDAPWVRIDLRSNTRVSQVDVTNRIDCCAERTPPIVIEVSTDGTTFTQVAGQDAPFTKWTAKFAPVDARYVRVRAPHRCVLHLAGIAMNR